MGVISHGAVLQNEVKAWPPLIQIGAGLDLVTNAQWFADVATPTTKATAVPISGEAGLDAKFLQVIKCVTDAVNEGWKQRYTYADEPRIKSGAHLSALIWVATTAGGTGITAKLVNSDASETSFVSVATDGDWSLLFIEDHSCAGTYVELQVTKDASGTFYSGGPITVSLGLNAIALPPRKTIYREIATEPQSAKVWSGLNDEATWTDIDVTALTSNLATKVKFQALIQQTTGTTRFDLYFRRNGSASGPSGGKQVLIADDTNVEAACGTWLILLDDAQIFEYLLDRAAGATALTYGEGFVVGYEEWE